MTAVHCRTLALLRMLVEGIAALEREMVRLLEAQYRPAD